MYVHINCRGRILIENEEGWKRERGQKGTTRHGRGGEVRDGGFYRGEMNV